MKCAHLSGHRSEIHQPTCDKTQQDLYTFVTRFQTPSWAPLARTRRGREQSETGCPQLPYKARTETAPWLREPPLLGQGCFSPLGQGSPTIGCKSGLMQGEFGDVQIFSLGRIFENLSMNLNIIIDFFNVRDNI